MSESYFVGVENAKTSEKLPYIRPGKYDLRVLVIKVFNSRSKGPMFVAEYEVLDSEGVGANEKGSRISHLIKLRGNDSALGNIKGLVAALTGEALAKVNQRMCDAIVGADNPASGTQVKAFAHEITTKANEPFTLVQYAPSEATMQTLSKAAKKVA